MKKKLFYIVSIILLPVITYSAAWFIASHIIGNKINQLYSQKDIASFFAINKHNNYHLNFQQVKPTGFPYSFAFEVHGIKEENNNSVITYKTPIIIGYNLRDTKLFLKHSGEIQALHKPLQSGFGATIKSNQYTITLDLPISLKLINIIYNNKFIEVANFLNNLTFQADKIQIFDSIDNAQIYDEDYHKIKVSWPKTQYFTKLEELRQSLLQQLEVQYSAKINDSKLLGKLIPLGLLYNFFAPISYTMDTVFYIKYNANKLGNIKDLHINSSKLNFQNHLINISNNLEYHLKFDIINTDMQLKLNADTYINSNFFNELLNFTQHASKFLLSIASIQKLNDQQALFSKCNEVVELIVNNKENFKLSELENKKYQINIDLNFSKRNNTKHLSISKFNIISGKSGILFNTQSKMQNSAQFDSKGLILLNNYDKIVDLVLINYYPFSQFNQLVKQNEKVYAEGIKYFLRAISDYPKSQSADISFQYAIDSTNLQNAKIGNVKLITIPQIYALGIYQSAFESIVDTKDINTLEKLLPRAQEDFKNQPQILETLQQIQKQYGLGKKILDKQKITKELWKKSIKQKSE